MFKRAVPFIVVVGLVLGALQSTAYADDFTVRVPFPFVVGNKAMPSGQYQVTYGPDTGNVLTILNLKGGDVALVPIVKTGNEASGEPRFTFTPHDNVRFLTTVALPGWGELGIHPNQRDIYQGIASMQSLERRMASR